MDGHTVSDAADRFMKAEPAGTADGTTCLECRAQIKDAWCWIPPQPELGIQFAGYFCSIPCRREFSGRDEIDRLARALGPGVADALLAKRARGELRVTTEVAQCCVIEFERLSPERAAVYPEDEQGKQDTSKPPFKMARLWGRFYRPRQAPPQGAEAEVWLW